MADNLTDHYRSIYMRIVEAFAKDKTAIQFLREDGEGGFPAGVYRMAREIDRLREKCGEPPVRAPSWEQEEDRRIDAPPLDSRLPRGQRV